MGCCLSKDAHTTIATIPQQPTSPACSSFDIASAPNHPRPACSPRARPQSQNICLTGPKVPPTFPKRRSIPPILAVSSSQVNTTTPMPHTAPAAALAISISNNRNTSNKFEHKKKVPPSFQHSQPARAVSKFSSTRSSPSNAESALEPALLEGHDAREPSPLNRSSCIVDVQDTPQLRRTFSAKSSSPSRVGIKHTACKKDASDDYPSKGRQLHRRTPSREFTASVPSHKRSSSRESITEVSSEVRKSSPLRRAQSDDPNFDTAGSVKNSIVKEEELRASAKHGAGKKDESQTKNPSPRSRSPALKASNSASIRTGTISSGNKNPTRKTERSPLRRSSGPKKTTNIAKPADCDSENLPISENLATGISSAVVVTKDSASRGERVVLKEISANRVCAQSGTMEKQEIRTFIDGKDCSTKEAFGACNDLKRLRSSMADTAVEVDKKTSDTCRSCGRPPDTSSEILLKASSGEKSEDRLPEILLRSSSIKSSQERFLFADGQGILSSEANTIGPQTASFAMPASLSKAYSILQAIADMNMASSMNKKIQEFKDHISENNKSQSDASSFKSIEGYTTMECIVAED